MLPIEVVVTRLDTGVEAVSAAARLLSSGERTRAQRFAADQDRRRFVAARARLRELLGSRLGIAPVEIELVYGRRGKPALAPSCAGSEIRFNVAHSGDVAAFAFAHGLEVGIDVEIVRDVPEADQIAAGLFSPAESEAYRLLDPVERPLAFFRCWTRKEALLKALGDGIGLRLDRCVVTLAPDEPARILEIDGVPGDRCGWALADFAPGRGFLGAVAVEAA